MRGQYKTDASKKPRILGMPGDNGACSLYRVVWPLEAIQSAGYADIHIPPMVNNDRFVSLDLDDNPDPDNPNLCNNYDMIVLQRQPEKDINRLIQACGELGIKVCFDLDDAALSIPPSNPNYMVWGRDKRQIERMAKAYIRSGNIPKYLRGKTPKEVADKAPRILRGVLDNLRIADIVTVTTPTLKDEYAAYNNHIHILPNQMNLEHWSNLEPIPHPDEVWIGWAGGWTHRQDLEMIVSPIANIIKRFPQTRLVIVGFEQAKEIIFDSIPEDKVITFPWHSDVKGYHNYVASFDIALAPSYPIRFNKAKSDIRVMEACLCGVPVVGSDTTYGNTIRESGGGLVAKSRGKWFAHLKRLIENESLRCQMGESGYNYVKLARTYQKNAHRWWEVYSRLLGIMSS